jgi:hypothetical protein
VTEDKVWDLGLKLGALILIGMIVQLSVIFYVFWSQYEGRKDNVANLRAGCERGKLDRADNARTALAAATNWRQAATVRRRDGDIGVAVTYEINAQQQEDSAKSLKRRSRINCTQAYPKARILR